MGDDGRPEGPTVASPSPYFDLLRRAFRLFSGKGARFLGAAVAFYALLSAAPLFVVVLHVVGAIFGRPRAESALWSGLGRWLAPEGLETARQLTDRLERLESSGSVVGTLLVIYGSTRLFRALRRALNQLWGIDLEHVERSRSTVSKYGRRYGGALLLALFVAVLVALIVAEKSAFVILASIGATLPSEIVWTADIITSVALAFVLFTVLFRFLPETDVTLREAAVSAIVSTGLFALGSTLVTLYVRHKHMTDLYAGASAVVLAIMWVYYSAQVFFFGACIGAALRGTMLTSPSPAEATEMTIDVHVTGGGTISNGELRPDPTAVARCTLCSREVEAAASLGAGAAACSICLRDRLDALSVARFRLRESRSGSLPWGKVTG
jgi:membrane protein